MASSMTALEVYKPKGIEYLKVNDQTKESVKDYVNITRQILVS